MDVRCLALPAAYIIPNIDNLMKSGLVGGIMVRRQKIVTGIWRRFAL